MSGPVQNAVVGSPLKSMTNDYWEILTTEDKTIRELSVWAMSHPDLVDLVDIDNQWLQLRIIPDQIIPRFPEYRGFLKALTHSSETRLYGYFGGMEEYTLVMTTKTLEATFKGGLSPVSIDLDTGQLSVWVTDGGTGKSTLVAGLSPINYSRMLTDPGAFPRFVRIGYEYKKGIYNYT